MIRKVQDESLKNWSLFECSRCKAQWKIHSSEEIKKIANHSTQECDKTLKTLKEWEELKRKDPNGVYAKGLITGTWTKMY